MSKRDEHTKQVKENIMNAADELLTKQGINYVTVSNICKKANVSIGSFYHHFSSKENVLAHYLTDAFEKRKEFFEEIKGEDVVSSLVETYALYNGFLLEKGFEFICNYYVPSNTGIFSYKNSNSSKDSAPIVRVNEELIQKAIEKKYLISDTDPQQLNYDLSTIEKGSVLDWCVSSGSYDLIENTSRLIRNYLMGFVTPKYKREFIKRNGD